jgi:hypothetical protein
LHEYLLGDSCNPSFDFVHWCKKVFRKILGPQFTSELGVALDQEEAQQDDNKKLGVRGDGQRKRQAPGKRANRCFQLLFTAQACV